MTMTKAMLLSLFLAVTATAAQPVKPRTAQEVAQIRADWLLAFSSKRISALPK